MAQTCTSASSAARTMICSTHSTRLSTTGLHPDPSTMELCPPLSTPPLPPVDKWPPPSAAEASRTFLEELPHKRDHPCADHRDEERAHHHPARQRRERLAARQPEQPRQQGPG